MGEWQGGRSGGREREREKEKVFFLLPPHTMQHLRWKMPQVSSQLVFYLFIYLFTKIEEQLPSPASQIVCLSPEQ